jgi:PIN domain nuclease of toxin-antitoxin system
VRLLVDTQCWLWMTSQPQRFSEPVRDQIARTSTELLLSAASAWEIAIKHALGKLRLPERPVEYVTSRLRETRTRPLAISWEHAIHVSDLPAHHRDPFDRLLIAQAQIEKVTILTADPTFALYDVEILRP